MKGIVFTEFLDLVETKFSAEIVDKIIVQSGVPSGAYTAIGTYPVGELVALVIALGEESKVAVPDLLRLFGRHLFGRFRELYPSFFVKPGSALDFLERVELVVHVEVRKLYPDAELPRFVIRRLSPGELEMTYRSSRGLADFAHGLIEGCADSFGEALLVTSEDLSEGRRTDVRFVIRSGALSG